MKDYWLYLLFKDKSIQDIIDSITGYSRTDNLCGDVEINVTLNATQLYYKENQDNMATVIMDDIMRQQNTEIDVKKLIKTVHINEANKTVTVVLKNGRKGMSRCQDPDLFDPYVGFSVALTYALFPSRTSAVKFVDKCIEKNEAKAKAKAKASAKKQAKKVKVNG